MAFLPTLFNFLIQATFTTAIAAHTLLFINPRHQYRALHMFREVLIAIKIEFLCPIFIDGRLREYIQDWLSCVGTNQRF